SDPATSTSGRAAVPIHHRPKRPPREAFSEHIRSSRAAVRSRCGLARSLLEARRADAEATRRKRRAQPKTAGTALSLTRRARCSGVQGEGRSSLLRHLATALLLLALSALAFGSVACSKIPPGRSAVDSVRVGNAR